MALAVLAIASATSIQRHVAEQSARRAHAGIIQVLSHYKPAPVLTGRDLSWGYFFRSRTDPVFKLVYTYLASPRAAQSVLDDVVRNSGDEDRVLYDFELIEEISAMRLSDPGGEPALDWGDFERAYSAGRFRHLILRRPDLFLDLRVRSVIEDFGRTRIKKAEGAR